MIRTDNQYQIYRINFLKKAMDLNKRSVYIETEYSNNMLINYLTALVYKYNVHQ